MDRKEFIINSVHH